MAVPIRLQVLVWATPEMTRWNHDGIARPYWRIYANDRPGWQVQWRGGVHHLTPDTLQLIAPETRYQTATSGPAKHCFLHATVDGPGLQVPPGIWSFPRSATMSALIKDGNGPGRDWAGLALLLHVFTQLPANILSPIAESPTVAVALGILRARTDGAVALDELVRATGCPGPTLVRRFRAAVGTTPHAWHLRHRVALACLALEQSSDSIETIAEHFGFCDRHHFTRAFTRWRGLAPATYRRQSVLHGAANSAAPPRASFR